ncbi:MAG: TraR/DksA C4-type zinc finger protein [Candidatus Peribacteraceae bacterium]|nr:TraR/DksA C4-type zinc finger protein [Candidatus Peribacteraceae bacterium]
MKPSQEQIIAQLEGLRRAPVDVAGTLAQTDPTLLREEGTGQGEEATVVLALCAESTAEQRAHIQHAIERTRAGLHGVCEGCGSKIPRARLQAIPFATMCKPCAEDAEGSDLGPVRHRSKARPPKLREA